MSVLSEPLNAFEYFNIMRKFGKMSHKINILSVEIQKYLIAMLKFRLGKENIEHRWNSQGNKEVEKVKEKGPCCQTPPWETPKNCLPSTLPE